MSDNPIIDHNAPTAGDGLLDAHPGGSFGNSNSPTGGPRGSGFGRAVADLERSAQIQQIKSIGSQPRVGVFSPNVISATNAPAMSTPGHVQNVRVRVTKISDLSSRVTVSFKRDPNDYYFSDAIVHVKGYKGNPAPARIASGQSPVHFVLENTGDPVSVQVQANGNLGPAPLQTAPSATLQLRKTPLASQSTTSGTGLTPQAITIIQNLSGTTIAAPGYFFSGGAGLVPSSFGGNLSLGVASVSPDSVTAYMFVLPFAITVNKITAGVSTAVAASTVNFGIYSTAGNLLLDSGALSAAVSGRITVNKTVTLAAGTYYFAQSASSNAATFDTFASSGTRIPNMLNLNTLRVVTAGNLTAAGVMPGTLGALVADPYNISMCCVLFEA